MIENMNSGAPYEYSTGENAEIATKAAEAQSVENSTQKELAVNQEKIEKFNKIEPGDFATIRGMKESYKVVGKNPDTLNVTVEAVDSTPGYSFGTEVSVTEILDFHK